MSTVVVNDLRHEMDESVVVSPTATKRKPRTGGPKPGDVKTSFLIRTLPRECNPTPVPTGGLSASASGLLSPLGNRVGGKQDAELEILELDNPFDDITEEKLKKLTGSQDLERVTSLQISVDSTKQSVEVIGELLPSLQQLRLQQSSLSSFRDLGTSLRPLRILWAMHCHISDLDGIGALLNLQELYLQHNNVSDISPLTMHEELRVVDLEGNRVADIGQVEQLAFCPQLTSLNLTGNPVETVEHYRQIVANFVPQLASLDDRAFPYSERVKLSDLEIDAAIQKHRDQLLADAPVSDTASSLRPMGANEISSPHQFSYSSSTASLNGLPVDSHNDDSGSRLTHGTDIVFAGNVSSALRRHRHEAETGSTRDLHHFSGSSSETSSVNSRPPSSHGLSDRPKTPARRISITDTLDRARELDTHKLKSRDAILDELKTWQLDSVGTSQIGVPRDTDYIEDSSSIRSRSRRKGSVDGISASEAAAAATRARLERRPNTSSGVLRNGVNVREAFVEVAGGSSNCPPRPISRGGSSRQRGSSSGTSGVDILILDGGDDSKRPCSPTKTPRGIFTTTSSSKKSLGHHHDWNLEVLSPKVDISSAKRHLPTSLTSKQQLKRSLASQKRASEKTEDDDGSSDSDADDELSVCPAVATEFGSPTPVPKTAFFNVAESLNAIEKWRDELEYDAEDTAILSVASLQESCLSPRAGAAKETTSISISGQKNASTNQQNSPTRQQQQGQNLALGPGNHESDRQIAQLLKEKHGQLKTRDGFRAYFRGIEKERLEGILRQTFADHDKVRRRMQIMTGLFRHELQC
ncbi:Leucine-rich repeat-containing protein 56 [Phytophthora pseudosyringae]|uniref:Leucine-rich repeat-containing protein 56 n=1 Tax=Phytophthora pseudosyringae TaxID=221518 RepID=A0A8T1VEK0_9STRA|nr:Leucine-rich repeat-containing protein 56 [Phytophthora pseudosyringae]